MKKEWINHKYEKELQLKKEIAKLEIRANERREYCSKNIDADNYEEVMRDYRAVLIKIDTKRKRIKDIYSSKKEAVMQEFSINL